MNKERLSRLPPIVVQVVLGNQMHRIHHHIKKKVD